MRTLTVSEVRKLLPTLVKEVAAAHEEIVVTRNGKPLARIVSWDARADDAGQYPLRGLPLRISEDFDEPMEELWEALGR